MKSELKELLVCGLEELGLDPAELLDSLSCYFGEILFWNPKVGLVKANERELVVKHFLDVASAAAWFDDFLADRGEIDVADLGTGVGLPGVMLALIFKNRTGFRMHLVEKQQRRCVFLNNLLPILGLGEQVQVHQQRVETLAMKFDLVTSRAFATLNPARCTAQMNLLRTGGKIAAYKGRRETILEEFKGKFPHEGTIIPLKVPFLNEERNLVVLGNMLA